MDRSTWIEGDVFFRDVGPTRLKAWKPFSLCVSILFELKNSDVEPRWHGWQIKWIAGLSCLRAVGHVLKKVDCLLGPTVESVVEQKWTEWRADRSQHWVFWDFIDLERNNVLKEFDFGFELGPYLEPDEYEVQAIVWDKLKDFREAVYWWRKQLVEIEALF